MMTLKHARIAHALMATMLTLPAGAANAQEESGPSPRAIDVFQDWSVFTLAQDEDLLCFAVATPRTSLPDSVRHGDVYFFVTTWRSGAAREQPSFKAGYRLKAESAVIARVDGRRFDLFTSDSEAYVDEPDDERSLITAMKRGRGLEVEAFSARGTATAYDFSLLGVTAAIDAANETCGQ